MQCSNCVKFNVLININKGITGKTFQNSSEE